MTAPREVRRRSACREKGSRCRKHLWYSLLGGGIDYGSVYAVSPTGAPLWSYTFNGAPDGRRPTPQRLVLDAQHNVYGTTVTGGTNGLGTVFKVTP
jgi:hypothetical protein